MLYNEEELRTRAEKVVAPSLTPDALQYDAVPHQLQSSCSSLSHPGCSTIQEPEVALVLAL